MSNGWYQDIVVGVDSSDESMSALDWAARTADLHGARLTAVATHPVQPDSDPGTGYLVEDARVAARRAADRARAWLDGRHPGGQDAEVLVLPGTAAHVLARRSKDCDLVVVGRRGLGAFDRALLGSTSSALGASAPGAVAVVPAGAATGHHRRIRVGVGSDDQPDVLGTAFAEAQVRGLPLEVLHVTATDPVSSALLGLDPVAASWREAAAVDLAGRLARWSEKYPEVTSTVVVRRGDAAANLLHGLTPNDMIVVGGRRHPVVTGRLLRSVPDAVLRAASGPVVVVHTRRRPPG